ncbi:hypothetical protein HAL1_00685 [Halomonas sp. HAL1]|nr:hypothetical protein HAL1_00685 [Halomonas sp. HAL1]
MISATHAGNTVDTTLLIIIDIAIGLQDAPEVAEQRHEHTVTA